MTRPDPDPWALRTASVAAERMCEALGHQLAAAYLHGSAVLGGFDPAVSDLDLLVPADGAATTLTAAETPAQDQP